MMRFITGVAVLMALTASSGARATEFELPPVTYPEVSRSGESVDAFVPAGWALETSAKGDLNGDGADDLVMVFQQQDPKNVIDNKSGLGVQSLNSNPRILVVALFDRTKNAFQLVLANHTLIPRYESPTLDDAFDKADGITVRKGAFTVTLGLFASAGGWDMGRMTFTFRVGRSNATLIGYDRNMVTRNTGKIRTVSINYATGRVRTATGSISDDAERVVWTNLKKKTALTITEVGDGMEFDPAGKRD
jgi:hypothetical protein